MTKVFRIAKMEAEEILDILSDPENSEVIKILKEKHGQKEADTFLEILKNSEKGKSLYLKAIMPY